MPIENHFENIQEKIARKLLETQSINSYFR